MFPLVISVIGRRRLAFYLCQIPVHNLTQAMKAKLPKLDIIHKDSEFVVVNKPATVLSIPDGYGEGRANLKTILEGEFGRVFVVHRLDGETSGVIVFALTEDSHRSLSLQFEKHGVQKIYCALVEGKCEQNEWEVRAEIDSHPSKRGVMQINTKTGKEAVTAFKVVERFRSYALIEAAPKSGRTHQIRVHLAFSGVPIVADKIYGSGKSLLLSTLKRNYKGSAKNDEKPLLSRLGLHAASLSFTHPSSGNLVRFEASLPKDMNAALNQLRKNH